jgi:hypothetical protein
MTPGFDGRTFVPIIRNLVETPRGQQEREGLRLGAWASLVLLLILLAYGSRLAGGDPPANALYRYETAVGGIIVYSFLLLILVWIGRGLPAREFFALHRPVSWSRALGLALLAYVVIFAGAGLIIWALDASD